MPTNIKQTPAERQMAKIIIEYFDLPSQVNKSYDKFIDLVNSCPDVEREFKATWLCACANLCLPARGIKVFHSAEETVTYDERKAWALDFYLKCMRYAASCRLTFGLATYRAACLYYNHFQATGCRSSEKDAFKYFYNVRNVSPGILPNSVVAIASYKCGQFIYKHGIAAARDVIRDWPDGLNCSSFLDICLSDDFSGALPHQHFVAAQAIRFIDNCSRGIYDHQLAEQVFELLKPQFEGDLEKSLKLNLLRACAKYHFFGPNQELGQAYYLFCQVYNQEESPALKRLDAFFLGQAAYYLQAPDYGERAVRYLSQFLIPGRADDIPDFNGLDDFAKIRKDISLAAASILGMSYHNGVTTKRDYVKAIQFFNIITSCPDASGILKANAYYNLGLIYSRIKPIDWESAKYCFLEAQKESSLDENIKVYIQQQLDNPPSLDQSNYGLLSRNYELLSRNKSQDI